MIKAQAVLINCMLKGINLYDEYSDATSAEATVYRATLLKASTSTHITPEFARAGNIIDEFISSCINTKQSFSVLVDRLTSAPYGMRKGPLPILFADHLLRLSDMPVFYFNTKEVTLDAEIIINAFKKPSEYYLYVEEETIQKSTYITALETLFSAYEIWISSAWSRYDIRSLYLATGILCCSCFSSESNAVILLFAVFECMKKTMSPPFAHLGAVHVFLDSLIRFSGSVSPSSHSSSSRVVAADMFET